MNPSIQKAIMEARELVFIAKEQNRKVWDVERGEKLVQIITEDQGWTLKKDHDRERRMYHLLHELSS
jgi:1,2-phenylacetyl-CoA epoxidase PaaB subunit